MPYLCGVTRDNWILAQEHVSDETIVVDLDRNHVMFGQQSPELPPVPGKKWIKLQNSLQEIAGNLSLGQVRKHIGGARAVSEHISWSFRLQPLFRFISKCDHVVARQARCG